MRYELWVCLKKKLCKNINSILLYKYVGINNVQIQKVKKMSIKMWDFIKLILEYIILSVIKMSSQPNYWQRDTKSKSKFLRLSITFYVVFEEAIYLDMLRKHDTHQLNFCCYNLK